MRHTGRGGADGVANEVPMADPARQATGSATSRLERQGDRGGVQTVRMYRLVRE